MAPKDESAKQRLDALLVIRQLCESREKAQRLIRAGQVLVRGEPATKPGHTYPGDTPIELKQQERFVSRGGNKLEAAFTAFDLNVMGQVAIDIGASTGGFTDCLLQHGAIKVYSFDVGKGQLHWKLRQDPRVLVHENVNARYLTAADLDDQPTFCVMDVSFISLTKVLPAVVSVLATGATLVTLIKPQFEAGPKNVQKGGVVRDPAVRTEVVERIREYGIRELGLQFHGVCESPLRGPAGNVEYLAQWTTTSNESES